MSDPSLMKFETPLASIVVPAFNVASTIAETLKALLSQDYANFEIVVVDDGSTDQTRQVIANFENDMRLRVVCQRNRGLAGARNSGIRAAKGLAIGFCDADDIWAPEKLRTHMEHLWSQPDVGVSYSGSVLIDDQGNDLGLAQMPRLTNVTPSHIFKRNPIGNGSAVVIRKDVLQQIAFRPLTEPERDWYFDETFRQSEDIECWVRIALETGCKFEGVPGLLTRYRINSKGLSAATDRQLDAWDRMVAKLSPIYPDFFAAHLAAARAYQLRYLARRAISDGNSAHAVDMMRASLASSWKPIFEEPRKTLSTLGATLILRFIGPAALGALMRPKGLKT